MTMPRRQIIRAPVNGVPADAQRQQQLQRLRGRLEHKRITLARWQSRLRRAFNATQRSQERLGRIERQISRLEK